MQQNAIDGISDNSLNFQIPIINALGNAEKRQSIAKTQALKVTLLPRELLKLLSPLRLRSSIRRGFMDRPRKALLKLPGIESHSESLARSILFQKLHNEEDVREVKNTS